MKAVLCLALLSLASAGASASAVTPIQKVLELMNGMLEKGKKEKHDEQVQFAAYKQFCDDTTVEKQRSIKEANEQIEMLQANIQKYEADAEALAKEIAGHDEDISVWKVTRRRPRRSVKSKTRTTSPPTKTTPSPSMLWSAPSST
jgi:septal ring factor EnvC (AmiA/AmiB activator)